MKVLVTGGAGYIGSHTTVELINSGHEVIIIDNLSNSCFEPILRVEKITGKKVEFINADVRNYSVLDSIFKNNKIDCVIHFAGFKSIGESLKKPIEYYDNNLSSTLTLLKVMRENNCKNFVFSSSASVYGVPERLPVDEDCKLEALNPYAETKLIQENILRNLYKSDESWNITILRYFNPVGAHESGLIGEDPREIPNNLLPYVSQVACGNLKEIGVFGNDYPTPDGTGVRDFIHVVDLARGHLKAIENKKIGLKTYNLGTGKGYSVLEMITAFSKACGFDLPYSIKPRRAGDLPNVYASAVKAEKELGFRAEYGIDKMCVDAWRWQKGNPDGYGK